MKFEIKNLIISKTGPSYFVIILIPLTLKTLCILLKKCTVSKTRHQKTTASDGNNSLFFQYPAVPVFRT